MTRIHTVVILTFLCTALAGCPRSDTPLPPDEPHQPTEPAESPDNHDHAATSPASGDNHTNDNQPATPSSPDISWLAKLGSDDRDELKSATAHFDALAEKSLPIFFAHLNHADDDVRRGAHFGLFGRFNAADSQFVTAMVEALDDSDRAIRHIALEALNKLPKKKFAELIPQLAPRLSTINEPDALLRAQIARMLARQKTAAQDALPALNETVKSDPDFNVRSASLFAIYNIARDAGEALPAPMHVLASDRDPRLRRIAAERLGKYGAAAAPAVPQLVAALADNGVPARAADDPLRGKDEPVCLAAVAALVSIGQPAVDALVNEVGSDNRVVRVLAIRTLGDIGPTAKAALATLEKSAAASDTTESAAAKTAIAKIRGEG